MPDPSQAPNHNPSAIGQPAKPSPAAPANQPNAIAGSAQMEPSLLDALHQWLAAAPQRLRALPGQLAANLRHRFGHKPAAAPQSLPGQQPPSPQPAAPPPPVEPGDGPAPAGQTAPANEGGPTIAQAQFSVLSSQANGQTAQVTLTANIPLGSVLRIEIASLSNGQTVVNHLPANASPLAAATQPGQTPAPAGPRPLARLSARLPSPAAIAAFASRHSWPIMLSLAALVYALAIGIGITRYPVYFFTDEAAHANFAANFFRDGWRNYYGEFLPTYFTASGWVNGTSVYLQMIPYLLFGKSVLVSRLVSAAVTLLGALALALLLRKTYQLRHAWVAPLVLATTPAWYLHARTAFEYMLVGAFYAIFLWLYNGYRDGDDDALSWAMLAGALTFYTHGLGQVLMGATGLAFFLIDLPYHFAPSRRGKVLRAMLVAILLFLPYIRYTMAHPAETTDQLARRGSYWVNTNLTTAQKLGQWAAEYWKGISLLYWFNPQPGDLTRHVMKGYGHGLLATAPFALYGLIKTLRTLALPRSRLALVAFLAAPLPSSIAAIGMPRMVWFAVPLAIFISIALNDLSQAVASRWPAIQRWVAVALFASLAGTAATITYDSQVNGPTWYDDYTLYGMQYGSRQVFAETILPALQQDPALHYVASTSWANGAEQFLEFFIPTDLRGRVHMGTPENFIAELRDGTTPYRFIAPASELEQISADPRFANLRTLGSLPYPNGQPGFVIFTIQTSPQIDQILEAQRLLAITPIADQVQYAGQTWQVLYSPLGMGQPSDLFDDDPATLVRGLAANPFLLELTPAQPISASALFIHTGTMHNMTITITLFPADGGEPVVVSQLVQTEPMEHELTIALPGAPSQIGRLRLEVLDNNPGTKGETHIRTVHIQP